MFMTNFVPRKSPTLLRLSMRKLFLSTFSVLLSAVPFVRASENPTDTVLPRLSLDECIAVALSESPTLKIADLEIERVDYSKKDVLAQLLPTVSFGGTYNRMIAKQVAYMNFDIPGLGGDDSSSPDNETLGLAEKSRSNKDEGFKMGLDNSFQVGFNASVPLIAPQLWASMSLSDAQIAQSVEQARASRLNLINQVRDGYYRLMLALDSRKTIQESYDMAALTHEIYTKQFSAGAASEYDVLRTSVAMKNVEPEIIQVDIAIRQARLQLQILMGVSSDFKFETVGRLADYEGTMYDDILSIDTDYSMNSDLVMNDLQINTLNQSVKVAKMAWYPTLALTANYNWTSSSDGNPFRNFRWNPYSIVGLSLNFPIYQGGARYNKIKQSQIQVNQMELTRENLERSVEIQVDLAMDNIALNVKQISSSSESVRQAEKAYSIMEQSFAIGAASYLDLRDAEVALTRSRLAYYQSIYNYLTARSGLLLLLGRE